MPTIDWNKRTWEVDAKWRDGGVRWSDAWGGVERQWHSTILPRIHRFLPANTILEIAPGFGRWTEFLLDQCQSLIAVDLSRCCIQACMERFRGVNKLQCHVNDGRSLDMVPDDSIDFVFSFDSLVHVESDVIEDYLRQLARKMKEDAVGFIHHSNLAHYRNYFRCVRGAPLLRTLMGALGLATRTHDRGKSVSADRFASIATAVGLRCISQECVNWASPLLIDCFSVITPAGSRWNRPCQVVRNRRFMDEARCARERAPLPAASRAA